MQLAGFIAQAKGQPGKFNYGTIGVGGSSHLLAENLKKVAGINLVEVPYKGAAQALLAITTSEVQIYFDAITTSLPQHRAGRLKILAITGDLRLPAAPEIPTFKELGLPQMTAYFWFGMMAPKGTPKPVIDLLHAEIEKALTEPDFVAKMAADGAITQAMRPEEFNAFVKADVTMWGDIVKSLNLVFLE